MTVKFLKSIPFTTCKSIFLSKLVSINLLPQRKELDDFVCNNSKNVSMLILNHQYCSLDELKIKILNASQYTKQYLYLAINKFYIYSTVDSDEFAVVDDYDVKLVDFCCRVLDDQYKLIKYTVRSDDDGTLGNFVHPVTTMFFEKYAEE
jgi:hypothetical protein